MSAEKIARSRGRRPTLSLGMVLEEAIRILDDSGETALTFRKLASELNTGVGSIYHYVKNRDDLLDGATNYIMEDVLPSLDDNLVPLDVVRQLSYTLFETLQSHPWAGIYLMRDLTMQENSLRIFEKLGQQFMRLGLSHADCFDAAGTVLTYVIGSGADGADERMLSEEKRAENKTQAEYLQEFSDYWLSLDKDEYPFLHAIAPTFSTHDDVAQFKSGLELILSGVQARLKN